MALLCYTSNIWFSVFVCFRCQILIIESLLKLWFSAFDAPSMKYEPHTHLYIQCRTPDAAETPLRIHHLSLKFTCMGCQILIMESLKKINSPSNMTPNMKYKTHTRLYIQYRTPDGRSNSSTTLLSAFVFYLPEMSNSDHGGFENTSENAEKQGFCIRHLFYQKQTY